MANEWFRNSVFLNRAIDKKTQAVPRPISRKKGTGDTFESFDPTIDKTGLENTKIDFTDSRNAINTTGNAKTDTTITPDLQNKLNGVTEAKTALQNFNGNIDQSRLSNIRGLRTADQANVEQRMNTGLDRLDQYSQGNSQVDRTIANGVMNRFDASTAAQTLSQAQRTASNPYLSSGAKQAAIAEQQRTSGTQRSQLAGQLAKTAQERAYDATKQYTDMATEAAKYHEAKFTTDITAAGNELDRELKKLISVGDLSSTEATTATDIWKTQRSAIISDLDRAANAAVALGQIDQTEARLNIEKNVALMNAQTDEAQLKISKLNGILDEKQINATIQKLDDDRISVWQQRAANAIIDWKTANQADDGSYDINDVSKIRSDAAAMSALNTEYQAITKNPNAQVTDEYLLSKMRSIPTPSEAKIQTLTNNLNQMKQQLVGTGEGQVAPEAWPKVEQTFKLLSLTNGSVKINAEGGVDFVGADGSTVLQSIPGVNLDTFKTSFKDYSTLEAGIKNGSISKEAAISLITSDPNYNKTQATSVYNQLSKNVSSTGTTGSTTRYTDEQWKILDNDTKWSNFEKYTNSKDIVTKEDWIDAGRPNPFTEAQSPSTNTSVDQTTGRLTGTINNAKDMYISDDKEANSEFDKLFTNIQNGIVADGFDTDKMDTYLPLWIEANKDRTIKIGGDRYKVKEYRPSNKAGETGKLVFQDSKGVEYVIEGSASKSRTSEQVKQDKIKSYIGNAFALQIPQLVKNIKDGKAGSGIANLLSAGTYGLIKSEAGRDGESTAPAKVGKVLASAVTGGISDSLLTPIQAVKDIKNGDKKEAVASILTGGLSKLFRKKKKK